MKEGGGTMKQIIIAAISAGEAKAKSRGAAEKYIAIIENRKSACENQRKNKQ